MTDIVCPTPCKKCLPVAHEGVFFPCAKALSVHLGVSVESIYQALRRTGSTDRCGKPRGGRLGNSKMMIVGKYSWPSVSAMAREVGVERSTVCKQLKRSPEKVLAAVMKWEREKEMKG